MATADPITITRDLRTTIVLARVDVGGAFDRHTATDSAGDMLSAASSAALGTSTAQASATLTSSFADPAHIWGRSSSNASFDTQQYGDVSALSEFAIDFHLDSPYNFAFNGTFGSSGDHPEPFALWNSAGWLVQLVSWPAFWIDQRSNDPGSFARTGLLFAGDYRLLVRSGAAVALTRASARSVFSDFDFTFDLTPMDAPSATPEPASLALLGSGLVGMVAAGRRRARKGRDFA